MGNEKNIELLALAHQIQSDVVASRRRLHENPELSFQEFETADFVEAQLKLWGYEPRRVGKTGLVAEITGSGGAGKTLGLRADMDALPGDEQTGLPFASKRPGIMHSCGHDAHTAILLGVAQLLPRLKDRFAGTVKLFFQPAEEQLGGAKTFVEAGELDAVDGVAALHVMTDIETGWIAARKGVGLAASDLFTIVVSGQAAHGAQPHRGVDAIVIASQIVMALQTLVSRGVAPLDSAVITVGTMNGGSAPNIIAPQVRLEGTLRTLSADLRRVLMERMKRVVCGIAENMGGQATLEIIEGVPPLVCDNDWVDRLHRVAATIIPAAHIHTLPEPSMGGEDFAFMLQKAPGVFWRLGVRPPGSPVTFTHSSTLMVDENAFPYGVAISCALVLDALTPGAS